MVVEDFSALHFHRRLAPRHILLGRAGGRQVAVDVQEKEGVLWTVCKSFRGVFESFI